MLLRKCLSSALGLLFVAFKSLYRAVFIRGRIGDFRLFEQKIHSQNGEDGIIRALFDKIGTTNRFCVEFGIHPAEGNTILLREAGWSCLWMDGGGDGDTIKKEFVTAENISALFVKYGVPKDFDLLSIDIDSNDYWVWQAITNYEPRVVVIEYNASIPPTESKVVEYDPELRWDGTDYFGASLLALEALGKSKGYTLITCDQMGINAFFVRSELIGGRFKVRSIADIYVPPGYGEIVNGRFIGHRPSGRAMLSV